MNIRNIAEYNKLKRLPMTREEIALRVLEIAKLIMDDGSYKNAVGCLGRMKTLSKVVSDYYWDEKMFKGETYEAYYLLDKDQFCKSKVVE